MKEYDELKKDIEELKDLVQDVNDKVDFLSQFLMLTEDDVEDEYEGVES